MSPAAMRMISAPVAVEPVNAILSTPGCRTRCAPTVGPGTGNHVDDAGRETDLAGKLREPQRSQRRRVVGLQHDRAARGQCRRELPRRHQQRVVPRHDLPGDADRLLQRVEEERAADRVRAARDRRDRGGEEAEVLDRPFSSAFTDEIALPTLRASSSASSLRFATIASASACSRRERSVGGVLPQSPASAARANVDRAVDVLGARERRREREARPSRARSARASRRPRRTRRRSRGRTPASRSPRPWTLAFRVRLP